MGGNRRTTVSFIVTAACLYRCSPSDWGARRPPGKCCGLDAGSRWFLGAGRNQVSFLRAACDFPLSREPSALRAQEASHLHTSPGGSAPSTLSWPLMGQAAFYFGKAELSDTLQKPGQEIPSLPLASSSVRQQAGPLLSRGASWLLVPTAPSPEVSPASSLAHRSRPGRPVGRGSAVCHCPPALPVSGPKDQLRLALPCRTAPLPCLQRVFSGKHSSGAAVSLGLFNHDHRKEPI